MISGKVGFQKTRWMFHTNNQAKILFQYIFVTVVSLCVGLFLSRRIDLLFLNEQAIAHFTLPFSFCTTIFQAADEILLYSLSDLVCVLLSATFTFSLLNYFASDLILAYQGIRVGLTIASLPKLAPICHNGELILLALLRGTLLVCFVFYLYRLTAYSLEFKKMTYQGRTSFSYRTLGQLFLSTIFLCGIIIVSNTIYCGLIFLI